VNIEIVNKQVSIKTGIRETDVTAVNKFFWQNIRKHIYDYNSRPVNIPNVCVIYPNAYYNKQQIYGHIRAIRKMRYNKRYKQDSPRRMQKIEEIKTELRKVLNIRKENKWVN
jgi:hypothetical protein